MDSATILTLIEIITVSCLGLVLGSFSTAITYREARNEAWYVLGKSGGQKWSFCPQCKHRLYARDLIPLFSWLLSKGCCRYCKKCVSGRYPLTELMSLLFCLGIYAFFGLNVSALILMFMAPFLIALVFIDLDHMILPNRLVAIYAVLSAAFIGYEGYLSGGASAFIQDHGIGLIAYPAVFGLSAFVMGKVLKKSAIGMGDIKFLFPAGLVLGVGVLSPYLILSGACGVLSAVLIKFYKKSDAFPFGPALILGFYVVLLLKEGGFL